MRCNKKIHQSETEANLYQIWYYLSKTDADIIEAEELYRVYHCSECRGWHITTKYLKGNEMDENFNLDNLDFTDGKIELDGDSSGPLVRWGFGRIATVNKIGFKSGGELEIPEIVVNGAPYKARGKKAGDIRTVWFTLETHNRSGEPYTLVEPYSFNMPFRVENKGKVEHKDSAIEVEGMEGFKAKFPHLVLEQKQIDDFNEKGFVYISNFSNLMKPSLAANLGSRANQLTKVGLWLRVEYTTFRVREGDVDPTTGKPKKYYDSYWSKITAYENEAAMNAAKSEEVVLTNGVIYPEGWGSKVDQMLDYIAGVITADNITQVNIAEWKLAGSEHVHAILKEAVERKDAIPPEKEAINAAIDKFEYTPF